MSLFKGVNNATMSLGGIYLNDGHKYLLEISATKLVVGRKSDNFFVGEFVVVESDDPKIGTGSKPSWVCAMKQDAALGNILAYIGSAMGINPQDEARLRTEVTEDVSELVVSAKNPLRGKFIGVVTKLVKTRAGGDFTKHYWEPASYSGASMLSDAPMAAARAPGAYPPLASAGAPPPPPPPPAVFPPSGWAVHPSSPGWYYQGQKVVSEADLRAGRV